MISNPSPLEILAAFAITFVAGASSVLAVAAYGQWMKNKGSLRAPSSNI